MSALAHVGVALSIALASGCTVTLPARETPARTEPVVAPPSAEPAAGKGRVYIEAVDGPARVERLGGQTPELICVSPCWADLPIGHHDVRFVLEKDRSRVDGDVIKVFEQPFAYRRALGKVDASVGMWSLGFASIGVGGSLMLTGGLIELANSDSDTAALTISGAAITALGALLFYRYRPVVQPGATDSWPIDAP